MKKYSATPGKGKTTSPAAAKCAYISRSGRYARGTDSCVCTWSGNLPSFARGNPDIFWSAVDEYERSNGRRYRTLEIALPLELTESQREDLARDFVSWVTQDGLPHTAAIHAGYGTNPHLHLIVCERVEDGIERTAAAWFKRAAPVGKGKKATEGGARKTQRLDKRDFLLETRKIWADMSNNALEKAGSRERIDHRTLEEQAGHPKPSPAQKAQRKRKTHKPWPAAKAASADRLDAVARDAQIRAHQLSDDAMYDEDFVYNVTLLFRDLNNLTASKQLESGVSADELMQIYAELEEAAGLECWSSDSLDQTEEDSADDADDSALRPR